MHYTYILFSEKHNFKYIGSTVDLRKRVQQHNGGKVKTTKARGPWKLIYYEAYQTKELARKAELFYKSSQGRRLLKKKLGKE